MHGSRVAIPLDVRRPFQVFVNGVAQQEGNDFELHGTDLVFNRELIPPHRWTPWTYLRTAFAGRYQTEHSVDLTYQTETGSAVANNLTIRPPDPQ
jgi:hypothetical protein